MIRSLRTAAILALALTTIGALGVAARSGGESALIVDDPAPASDARSLFLVYSINNVGKIDVCGCKRKKVRQGSITRRASYIRQALFHHPQMLLIDGGNTLFGPDDRKGEAHERRGAIEKAKVLVESYNRIGYRAMLVGNYDLLLGLDELRTLEAMAQFPFLSANLVDRVSKDRIFPPSAELEVGGVRVGILGLTLNTIPEYFLDKASPQRPLELRDPIEEARREVPALRERNDLVIVLSNNAVEVNRSLAAEVAGIDMILDPLIELGNHKLWIDAEQLVEWVGETMLVRTDAQGARLGTMAIRYVPGSRPLADATSQEIPADRSQFTFERVSLEPHMLEDPEIQLLVQAYKDGSRFIDTTKLPPLPQKEKFLTAATCQACHEEQYDFWKGTKHAHAFATLEENDDQWRQDCIGCHVLGYGQTFIAPQDAEPYKDVQCESCHGLNPEHPLDPAAHPWPRIQETDCLICHNKEQTREDFHFARERAKVACPKAKTP